MHRIYLSYTSSDTSYICIAEGVKFSSTEKCGGKLGVRYKEQWEYVCEDLNEADAKKVCGVLKCNDSQELLDEQKMAKEIKVTIKCSPNHYRVSQCIQYPKQCKGEPAKIKCEGKTQVPFNSIYQKLS